MSKKKSHSNKKGRFGSVKTVVWVLAIAGITAAAVMGGLYLEKNTRISDITVTGNYFTEDEAVKNSINSPIGLLADSLDYPEYYDSIRSLPYVEDVNIRMNFRGILTFEISEMTPLALLTQGSDRVYVGAGGIKLPIKPEKTVDVPILYGFKVNPVADTLKSDAFRQVEQFLTAAKDNELGWVTISEVAWNERDGIVALSYENGVKLIFGQNNFEEKMTHWKTFYTDVIAHEGISQFEEIDLRFSNQIVTRKP